MTTSFAKMLDEIHDDFDEPEEPVFAGFAHCAGETAALLRYAENFMNSVDSAQEEAANFMHWLAHNRARFNLNDELFSELEMSHRGRPATGTIGRRRWQEMRDTVRALLEQPTPEGAVSSGLAAVSAALGFDELDTALFGIIFRYGHDNTLERLFDLISQARKRPTMLRRFTDNFAILTDRPQQEVARCFRPEALLCASGAIRIDEDWTCFGKVESSLL